MSLASAAALLPLIALGCASRGSSEAAGPPARVVVETRAGARHPVAVELARTGPERERGLMWRTSLAPDAGMLFLFEESEVHSFWMQNTLISLDMIFIGDEGRIVGIVPRAEPRTTTARFVDAPSRYVLEVNGGWSEAHGVSAGDRVRFEGVPRF